MRGPEVCPQTELFLLEGSEAWAKGVQGAARMGWAEFCRPPAAGAQGSLCRALGLCAAPSTL